MFLNRLQEDEKVAFLKLAHHIARCDNAFSEDEQEIIKKYCLEMQIDDIQFNEEEFDIYEVLDVFQNRRSRKIVVLEIMALIYSDNFLHEEERLVLEKIFDVFDLNYHITVIYAEWAKTMLSLFKQGNALIEL